MLLGWAVASPAWAQDPLKVAPKHYTVVFENDQVRVLRATINPGDKVPMHDHPNHIVVPLDTVTSKFGLPDGKSVDAAMKAGEPVWSDATKHAPESTSKQSARVIIIELKGKAGAK
jgi:hypothetical protein